MDTPVILRRFCQMLALALCLSGMFYGGSANAGALPTVALPANTSEVSGAGGYYSPLCKNWTSYGLAAGLVACLQDQTGNAVHVYVARLTVYLHPYIAASVVLAIILFGMRVTTAGVDQLVKEGMMFLFKVGIATTLALNGSILFNVCMDAVTQLVGWVMTPVNTIIIQQGACPVLAAGSVPMPAYMQSNFQLAWDAQITTWHTLDCMLDAIFGDMTSNTMASASSSILGHALGMIIAAALLSTLISSPLGILIAIMGVTACLSIILTLSRAIFLVLISYLTIGFAAVLAPVIAPMLMYNTHDPQSYTKQFFDRWLSVIISTIFQPMFYIGFIGLAFVAINIFVIGNEQAGGDKISQKALAGCVPGNPATVCSLQRTFASTVQIIKNDSPVGQSWRLASDVAKTFYDAALQQVGNVASTFTDVVNDIPNTFKTVVQHVATSASMAASSFLSLALDIIFHGTILDVTQDTLKQALITLIGLLLTVYAVTSLMKTVPQMAQAISMNVGLGLISLARVPFEKAAAVITRDGGDALRSGVRGNLITGAGSLPRAAGNAATSATGGAWKQFVQEHSWLR